MKKKDQDVKNIFSDDVIAEKMPDDTSFYSDLVVCEGALFQTARKFNGMNAKWLLNDEDEIDKEKLSKNAHLLGNEWLEQMAKLSDVAVWAGELTQKVRENMVEEIREQYKEKGDKS